MKQNSTKRALISKLSAIMPENEAEAEIDFLLREQFSISKKDLIICPEKIEAVFSELEKIIKIRTNERKPLQYIVNKAVFYGDIYYVNENVLIPRPETELLVQEVVKYADDSTKILDIGTGSGCIAVSLAKNLKNDYITSCDISKEALFVAEKNAQNICPERKIKFIHSNIFSNIQEKINIIVSNPPYISEKLKSDMEPEVLKYEPVSALFAQDDGLYFYKEIITNCSKYLLDDGMIFFEIGIDQDKDIVNLLKNNGFLSIEVIPDLNKIPRIIIAKSVCDFGDERKDDTFQRFAAYTSCGFVKELLENVLDYTMD